MERHNEAVDGVPILTTTSMVKREMSPDGGFEQRESSPLCSVEIGETAKGDLQIKSVKAYAQNVTDAGRKAFEEIIRLQQERQSITS